MKKEHPYERLAFNCSSSPKIPNYFHNPQELAYCSDHSDHVFVWSNLDFGNLN